LSNDFDGLIDKISRKKNEVLECFCKGKIYKGCKNCRYLYKSNEPPKKNKIQTIILNHFTHCNLKCVHCGFAIASAEGYKCTDTNHKDVLNIIKYLGEKEILAKNVKLDIGGGEPSLSKGLQEIVEYAVEIKNMSVHINTNCAQYMDFWVYGVQKGLINLTLTPDAGSKEVYEKIKGADYFDIVWENIEKYNKATDKGVRVKFIMEYGNLQDIENMAAKCVECKVREVVINKDFQIAKNDYYRLLEPVRKFKNLLSKNGITVRKGNQMPIEVWGK
jgi:MoaA/NifB/PqqE/SkfB family radical SAM enzyme